MIRFTHYWGLAMSLVILYTYLMALLHGGEAVISVNMHNEAVWEFPLLGMGFVWYLFQLRKEMR